MPQNKAYLEAEEKIERARLSGTKELNLSEGYGSGLELTELPESLSQLKQLRSLTVCHHQLTTLPESLGQLTQLESLDLSNNVLIRLPESLGNLKQLKTLRVGGNRLTALPESLGQLTQLQSLELTRNELVALPESLGDVRQLETLSADGNRLTTLPESLTRLAQLQSLDLSSNALIALPESLGQLTQLTSIDLSENELKALPESLGRLTQLQRLYLFRNKVTHLPSSIVKLKHLNHLSLSANPIKRLPNNIGELRELKSLTLGATDIQVLPQSFSELTALEFLSTGNAPLTQLPDWIGNLKSLQGLDLSNDNTLVLMWEQTSSMWNSRYSRPENRLGHNRLPESLRQLPLLKQLYLHGNSGLDLPLEILGPDWNGVRGGNGTAASPTNILEYYFRTRRAGRPLNEAKLILVGRGGVGKTCLIKRLIHGTFDECEPETPGIEIQPWEITLADGDRVRLHVWDFGGQEILHATHQFFLTERTVYLLVLSGREGTATQDAEYWLQLIRSFGGDSKVIVALNKSHQHPFDVNRGLLLEKYPQIAAFVRTDCQRAADGSVAPDDKEAMGLEELRLLILGGTANLEHRKADFPADWFDIKERLAGMKENFVTWDQYREICRGLGEQDAKAQRDLAGFLHILGIALNYRDDPRLRETHVLNPRWVTEGIYSILRSGQKAKHERKGVLEAGDLERALNANDYPQSSHEFLLALMEKFQLCFQLPGGPKRYLVPELLGENQPDEIKSLVLNDPGLGFRYQYEVLPEGLLPRFIVQTHVHSESNPEWRWRTGVVLNRNGCRAVVRADARERRVDIHISGPERQRRDLLAIIRERFDEQHLDLKGLVVDQRVPVLGEVGVTVSYSFLVTLEGEGEAWCRPEGARQKHRVADLLNGVEPPEHRADRRGQVKSNHQETMPSKRHVFLSYCHDNMGAVENLRDDLLAAGEEVWWDQDILPGHDWKLSIDQAMKNAYAVVLCLSKEAGMRTTTGIYPEAANAIGALREYAPGDIFLIPVRVSDCAIPPFEIDATRRLDRLQFVDLFPPAKRASNLTRLIAAIQAAPNHP
jgi:internalin A